MQMIPTMQNTIIVLRKLVLGVQFVHEMKVYYNSLHNLILCKELRENLSPIETLISRQIDR